MYASLTHTCWNQMLKAYNLATLLCLPKCKIKAPTTSYLQPKLNKETNSDPDPPQSKAHELHQMLLGGQTEGKGCVCVRSTGRGQ